MAALARLCGDASLEFIGAGMSQYYRYYDSPLGQILLTASEIKLTGLHFVGEKYYPGISAEWRLEKEHTLLNSTMVQLAEYFSGTRKQFDVPLAPQGTDFQRQVWKSLTALPYGTTATYGQLAVNVGSPKAVRAVGAANGRNPISIIVPCHRVIGADGSLTGYAGGLARKQSLLQLESAKIEFRLTA